MDFFNLFSQLCNSGFGQSASSAVPAVTQAAATAVTACTDTVTTYANSVTNLFTMLCRMLGLGC